MSSILKREFQARVGSAYATSSRINYSKPSRSSTTSSISSDSNNDSEAGPVATDDGYATENDAANVYATLFPRARERANDLRGIELDKHHLMQNIVHAHFCNNIATGSNTTIDIQRYAQVVRNCYVGMRLTTENSTKLKHSKIRLPQSRSRKSNHRTSSMTIIPGRVTNSLSRIDIATTTSGKVGKIDTLRRNIEPSPHNLRLPATNRDTDGDCIGDAAPRKKREWEGVSSQFPT